MKSLRAFIQSSFLSIAPFAVSLTTIQANETPKGTTGETPIDQATLKPFLENNCIRCHGEKKQKGKLRFDQLDFSISDKDEALHYQDVLDVLNSGEMPPEEGRSADRRLNWKSSWLNSPKACSRPANDSPPPVAGWKCGALIVVNTPPPFGTFLASNHLRPGSRRMMKSRTSTLSDDDNTSPRNTSTTTTNSPRKFSKSDSNGREDGSH